MAISSEANFLVPIALLAFAQCCFSVAYDLKTIQRLTGGENIVVNM